MGSWKTSGHQWTSVFGQIIIIIITILDLRAKIGQRIRKSKKQLF